MQGQIGGVRIVLDCARLCAIMQDYVGLCLIMQDYVGLCAIVRKKKAPLHGGNGAKGV